MYSWEIENKINECNGELSETDFIYIYDNSPQMTGCSYDGHNKYKYCFWLSDYKDLYFNIRMEKNNDKKD